MRSVLIRHGLFSCFLKSSLLEFVFQVFQENNFTSVVHVRVASLWKEIVNPFFSNPLETRIQCFTVTDMKVELEIGFGSLLGQPAS